MFYSSQNVSCSTPQNIIFGEEEGGKDLCSSKKKLSSQVLGEKRGEKRENKKRV